MSDIDKAAEPDLMTWLHQQHTSAVQSGIGWGAWTAEEAPTIRTRYLEAAEEIEVLVDIWMRILELRINGVFDTLPELKQIDAILDGKKAPSPTAAWQSGVDAAIKIVDEHRNLTPAYGDMLKGWQKACRQIKDVLLHLKPPS